MDLETDCESPAATGDDYDEWTSPANAYALDSSYASMALERQDYYNFSLPVPKYSTVTGIAVFVNARRYNSRSPRYQVKLSWNGGTSWTSTKDTGSFLYTSSYYKQVGGVDDTWGRAWTTSELSNANFRVYLEQTQEDVEEPYLNHVCVKVYYSAASSPSSSSTSISSSSISVTKTSSSVSVTKTSSSISVTKSSTSVTKSSTSVTKSSSSVSVTKTSSSSSALSKSSSSLSISVTKSSASSSSISVTKTSSSVSSSSVSVTKTSSSISVTKTSSSVSVTKSSSSISVTKTSSSCCSASVTKSSSSVSLQELTVTYRFTDYDTEEAWSTNPAYMTDGVLANQATTEIDLDTELCDENNCPGIDLGFIRHVQLRAYGDKGHADNELVLRPVFTGGDGSDHNTSVPVSGVDWSDWIEITTDPNAPADWDWTDVQNLDCDVVADRTGEAGTFHCGQVEIRITYLSPSVSSSSSLSVSVTKSSASSESSWSSESSESSSSLSSSSCSCSSSSCSCSSSSSWSSGSSGSLSSQSISQTKSSRSLTSSSSSSLTKSSTSVTKTSSSSSFSMYDIGTTVLRLAWDGRIVNFSDQEVNRVLINSTRGIDLERLQNRQPVVYELGEPYKIIDVTLDAYMSPMTALKLESVRKVTGIITLTMYYSDGVTQAEQFSVRVDPNCNSYFEGGERNAEREMGLVFFEANAE